jgi:hypothetical protein
MFLSASCQPREITFGGGFVRTHHLLLFSIIFIESADSVQCLLDEGGSMWLRSVQLKSVTRVSVASIFLRLVHPFTRAGDPVCRGC